MKTAHQSKAAAVRARLDHPIIDSDGHQVEPGPVFLDYLKQVGGDGTVAAFRAAAYDTSFAFDWLEQTTAQRHESRSMRPTWWAVPARNTLDLATAMFPALFHARMEELGLDLSVVYPTYGLLLIQLRDAEVRRAACRALNLMKRDMFAGLEDRLIPVASIPMHTPTEAIDELDFAVGQLGLRAVMMASYVKRPIQAAVRISPEAARYSYWMDTFGLDSEHDYDPVWAKCVALGVMPTFHSLGYGWGSRAAPSNYIHNHLGNFAASADAICRGLLLGGVPKRFPQLKFAFMEGGVAWARNLYCDLLSHWNKRNAVAMENYNPTRADANEFVTFAERWGGHFAAGRGAEILADSQRRMARGDDPALHDEWAPSGLTSARELSDIFTRQFYFGCEGDDPLNPLALDFKGAPFNSNLRALYGSDLGHWDVPDMSEAAEEAYELVEHGLLDPSAFRAMVFDNAVEFWTSGNPDFFKGTSVEPAVKALLGAR